MGVRKKSHESPQHRYRLMWNDVIYEPGVVKVIAFDDQGKAAAEKTLETAGKAYQLKLEPDRTVLTANGDDLSFVTVSVVDKNGIFCPTATNQLKFQVKGSGSFRAACNGDATSLEPFHMPTMKLFSGKLVVVVQSSDKEGDMTLKVSGKGLKSASVNLKSVLNTD